MRYRIIGFDPASTKNIGWSSITLNKKPTKSAQISDWEGGTFVMPQAEERWQVLWPMLLTTDVFLEDREPHLVVVEKTSSFAGGFITGQVSQCMGVLLAACGKNNVPVEFVYPTSVKKIVAGHGRASKSKMKKAVKKILEDAGIADVKFHSDHTADASATILYWLINAGVISKKEDKQ